jgi:hypothetical protein
MRAFGRWIIIRFKEAKFIDFVQAVLSVLVLAVGTFAACVYYGQLQEMRHTNELTLLALQRADRSSLDASKQFQVQLQHFDANLGQEQVLVGEATAQAAATNKLAGDAARSASASETANNQNKEQLKQEAHAEQTDERPWLAVEAASYNVDAPPGPGLIFDVKNTGRTPAVDIKIIDSAAMSDAYDSPIIYSRDDADRIGKSNALIAPSDGRKIADLSFTGLGFPTGQFHDEWVKRSKAFGTGPVVVVGAISYTDSYGTKGFTRFCMLIRDGKSSGFCTNGNLMQ